MCESCTIIHETMLIVLAIEHPNSVSIYTPHTQKEVLFLFIVSLWFASERNHYIRFQLCSLLHCIGCWIVFYQEHCSKRKQWRPENTTTKWSWVPLNNGLATPFVYNVPVISNLFNVGWKFIFNVEISSSRRRVHSFTEPGICFLPTAISCVECVT